MRRCRGRESSHEAQNDGLQFLRGRDPARSTGWQKYSLRCGKGLGRGSPRLGCFGVKSFRDEEGQRQNRNSANSCNGHCGGGKTP